MKKNLFFILISFFSSSIFAQAPIMLCDSLGNTCTPYYQIDSAYAAAVDGNYMYIPGGIFTFGSSINKRLHIIGAGYRLDSAIITNTTQISGGIVLGANASGSSFEGMYLTGSITGPTINALQNLTFKYLNIASISLKMSNSLLRSSIVRTGTTNANLFYTGINNEISNCFIADIGQLSNSIIQNCIGIYTVNNSVMNLFKNNIFDRYPSASNSSSQGSGNSLVYNVYTTTCPIYCISSIYAANNILLSEASVFAAGTLTTENMQLQPASAAMTAGENGTQVGVFGGLFPFKLGGVPSNPHVYQKSISPSTNSNGQLPVQIKVRAEGY
ncbi:MAG: hypothetical protein IPI46_01795 [Bacteroidetes bacterium]|nr:hypothetical protein [Bacteroidota bacterium]